MNNETIDESARKSIAELEAEFRAFAKLTDAAAGQMHKDTSRLYTFAMVASVVWLLHITPEGLWARLGSLLSFGGP